MLPFAFPFVFSDPDLDFEGGGEVEAEGLVGEVTLDELPFCLLSNQEINDFNSGE